MKRPSLKKRSGSDSSSVDEKTAKTIVDALSADDKVVEIRPAKRSKGFGLKRFLVLGAAAMGVAYWVRNSQRPEELIESVKEKTGDQTHQAGETIEEKSESASKRIEEGSEWAGETVQEAGGTVAKRTEEAGEKAADETRGN